MAGRTRWSIAGPIVALSAISLAAIGPVGPAAGQAPAPAFELLGEAVIERTLEGSAAPVGGLSGLSFDPGSGTFWAVSDDRSQFGPARLYELAIDFDLEALAVEVLGSVTLHRADGSSFPEQSIDPEGLALTPAGTWIVASEGQVERGLGPALFEFDRLGHWLGEIPLPRRFRPRRDRGARHNLALESATITPDGRWLFTVTENALLQDGPPASAAAGSSSRLLKIDLARRRVVSTYLYRTEPVATAPAEGAFAVNGVVDLLALDGERLLALERSFTAGKGNVVKLFLADLTDASDVTRVRRLERRRRARPVAKRLLVDLADLGLEPDNLEGMAFGPRLSDGRRPLLLTADDNFNPRAQRNQLVVLAVADGLETARAPETLETSKRLP